MQRPRRVIRFVLGVVPCGIAALALCLVMGIVTAAQASDSEPCDTCCRCQRLEFDSAGTKVISVPDFCIDGGCEIHVWQNVMTIGAFSYGLWPVYYWQSADGEWIGWPCISLGGVGFSSGSGTNGDRFAEAIFIGRGDLGDGDGTLQILDDSSHEGNPSEQWTIVWELPGWTEYEDDPAPEYRLIIILCPL